MDNEPDSVPQGWGGSSGGNRSWAVVGRERWWEQVLGNAGEKAVVGTAQKIMVLLT